MRVNDRVGREKIALCGALLAVDTEDDAGIPTPRKELRSRTLPLWYRQDHVFTAVLLFVV